MATALRGDAFQITITETGEQILVDGSVRETHADASLFTQLPVGRGSVISDHKQDAPSFLTADLIVTDTPKQTPETNIPSNFGIITKILNVRTGQGLDGVSDVETKSPTSFLERGKSVYERLLKAQRDGELLTVQSTHRLYSNMVLTRVEVPVDNSDRSTIISVDFQQILFADSEEVPILVVERPKLKNEKNKGPQESEQQDSATAGPQQAQSLLSRGAEAVSNLFGGG